MVVPDDYSYVVRGAYICDTPQQADNKYDDIVFMYVRTPSTDDVCLDTSYIPSG